MQEHYADGAEAGRLGGWSLERLRTEELLDRLLPRPPAAVLDAGGGPGRYAGRLAGLGYRVTLLDPVPGHVADAAAAGRGAYAVERGDATALPHPPSAFDAVLLLGPLYHLVDRADRVAALREAARVVRPGGVVVAAAICRFAALLDGFARRYHLDDRFRAIAAATTATGQHRNPTGLPEYFTTAYFHRPADLAGEVADGGLAGVEVLGVEGPAWLWGDRGGEPDDDRWRDAALWAARALEADPDAMAMSAHLLAAGRRP
jgi:SAM-dependent methyltransferase